MILYALATVIFAYVTLSFWPRWAKRWGLMDEPIWRSAHKTSTPRGAGVLWVVWMGGVCALAVAFGWVPLGILWWLLGLWVVAFISLLDDRLRLPVSSRLLGQALAVVLALKGVAPIQGVQLGQSIWVWGVWAWPLSAISLLWSINLFNFMDGSDGWSGLQAWVALLVGGGLAWLGHAPLLAWFCWGWVLCLTLYLVYNFPPARLFMGDAGSCSLGYLLTSLAFYGQNAHGINALYWPMAFSWFIMDATFTLLWRLLRRQPLTQPHLEHGFQRLLTVLTPKQLLALALVWHAFSAWLIWLAWKNPYHLAGCVGLQWLFGLLAYVWIQWRWGVGKTSTV